MTSTSNFQFLSTEWPAIYTEAAEAEKLTLTSPKACAVIARSTLEMAVNWLYQNDSYLEYPYDTNLSKLIHERSFRDILIPNMFAEIKLIKDIGNNGSHGKSVKQDESIVSIKHLFRFLNLLSQYYSENDVSVPPFDMSLIPDGKAQKESDEKIKLLEAQLEKRKELDAIKKEAYEEKVKENELLQKQIQRARKENAERRIARDKVIDIEKEIPVLVSEAVTRKLYIDVLLKDAGWDNLIQDKDIEYKVTGMPLSTNKTGIGYADYVLWGKDGKPLAVVEAKKTMVDARKGKHQAELYADCLQQVHGQRPIIFYTNGFDHYIWDDTFYMDREIEGFYTADELQLLIDRRTTRKDIRLFKVNAEITGRDYQLEAIKRIAENFAVTKKDGALGGSNRAGLLVMATGSGKTRTSCSIVDMLTKCNWAKRVLFLADRNALVTQAKNAFKEHLPELSAIDLTKEKEDNSTRLVFSTYPTIINKIDKAKSEGKRFYGVGHFDLIIIDETHRSVYQKYKAIFDYFDSLLIGLTATPIKQLDRNTYSLFDIEDDNPTFAYELNTAVNHGYLVPPKGISVPLKFPLEGIKYNELSDVEQREYEEKYGDPTSGEVPDEIGSGALNRWLFNTDTVDKVLEHLMNDGITVDGGDKIGKTIIFAKNHSHAKFIEKRFNKNYPELGSKFLRVIDNYEDKAQSLLEKFTNKFEDEEPQIAVSVDMMDTGVDAPRVVNLVFFKLVKSVSKFWQMIGRGTRLCPNLFGPGDHKTEFLIFDYCQNLEYFGAHVDGATGKNMRPLRQQIFEAKLNITQLITNQPDGDVEDKQIRDKYLNELHGIISTLDEDRFIVRKQLRHVKEYSHKSRWLSLSKSDLQEIKTHLSHLSAPTTGDDEKSRRFDMLVLAFQTALLSGSVNTYRYKGKIHQISVTLAKKDNIPEVAVHMDLIKKLRTDDYWESISVKKLEDVRVALRDLIKYIETEKQKPIYTNFEDDLDYSGITISDPLTNLYTSLQSYKDRVEKYIRDNINHITIRKLSNNISITKAELDELEQMLFIESVAGTKEDFIKEYGERPLGAFIRSITGLDQSAVNEAFADFLQVGSLRADQMTFVKTIISYLTKNGTLDKRMLYEAPFTDINDQGISGVFENQGDVNEIVKIITLINGNAGVA